ncbi:MAG: T9SS type A sorting domain-containing protein [Bacteroidetes bacterium]|nr:T9SS type A sorting domain-containing protein [Bacteroidota bacterium]
MLIRLKKTYSFLLLHLLYIIGFGQSSLTNLGTTSTLYIGPNHTIHCDASVSNETGATMQFDGASSSLMEVGGDFTNSATGILTSGVGTISFVGSAAQNADFGGDNLYNLKISNTSGDVTLTRAATVTNNLNFSSGDLNTDAVNILSLTAAATATGAANGNHVHGPMNKTTTSTSQFTFPIGNGTKYRPASITPTTTGSTVWQGEYFFTSHAFANVTDGTITHVSSAEYWTLARTSGAANGVVTLTWDAASGVTALVSLNTGYYNTTPQWTKSGQNNVTGTTAAGTIDTDSWTTWSGVDKFTLATTASVDNGLPVELLDFTATKEDKNVWLKWSTASEINSDYFNVLKSNNGYDFNSIGEVSAAGTSNKILNYDLLDPSPKTGICYYKLREFDKDGSSMESKIVALNFTSDFNLLSEVYPNPSDENTTLFFNSESGGLYKLQILDLQGNALYFAHVPAMIGENKFHLSLSDFAAGQYLIRLTAADNTFSTLKFVKKE